MIVYDIQQQIIELYHKWFSSDKIAMFIFPFVPTPIVESILIANNICPRRLIPISKQDCYRKFWFSVTEFTYLIMRFTISEIYYGSYVNWLFVPLHFYTCKETRFRKDICYDNSSYL